MKYELTDYQGNKIELSTDKASKIAQVAGLIEVEVNGVTHYINPSNIAGIKPKKATLSYKTPHELGMPNLSDRS